MKSFVISSFWNLPKYLLFQSPWNEDSFTWQGEKGSAGVVTGLIWRPLEVVVHELRKGTQLGTIRTWADENAGLFQSEYGPKLQKMLVPQNISHTLLNGFMVSTRPILFFFFNKTNFYFNLNSPSKTQGSKGYINGLFESYAYFMLSVWKLMYTYTHMYIIHIKYMYMYPCSNIYKKDNGFILGGPTKSSQVCPFSSKENSF